MTDILNSNLHRNNCELAESEKELYFDVISILPLPLLLLDLNGNVRTINFAARDFFQNVMEKSLSEGASLEEVFPELYQHLHKFMTSFETELAVPQTVYSINDQEFNLLVNFYRLRNKSAQFTGTMIIISHLTDYKEAEAQLRYISFHDALTKLFNRAYFEEELKRLESGRFDPVGIISCDVDGLKVVNDVLGHQAGDTLLKAAGNIIRSCFRESDVVARIGGDEFAVLLPASNEKVVERAAERLKKAIKQFNAKHPNSSVSISQGWAVRNDTKVQLNKVYQEADHKMYQQKPWNRELFLESFYSMLKMNKDQMYKDEF